MSSLYKKSEYPHLGRQHLREDYVTKGSFSLETPHKVIMSTDKMAQPAPDLHLEPSSATVSVRSASSPVTNTLHPANAINRLVLQCSPPALHRSH